MSDTMMLFLVGAAAGAAAFLYLALVRDPATVAMICAALCAGLLAYTIWTVAEEGVWRFVADHSTSLWGVQVWYDLIIALGVALLLLVPRARAAGVDPVPFILLTTFTGSIGMLALAARTFQAEHRVRTARPAAG